MRRLVSVEEERTALAPARRAGSVVGFVPTMGALHDGHLSLVRASKRETDITVVSIFVNPTQFGPDEDFAAYPRDLDADAAMLEAESADFLFVPTIEVMYPLRATTQVQPGPIAEGFCGAARPGHFTGVATVVVKLLDIIGPDVAFFGEKDYQQLKVIESVVRDLDIPTRIVGCPIVREPDGLAMSSRNRYLTPQQREQAAALHGSLSTAREAAAAGETSIAKLEGVMAASLSAAPGVDLEYAAVVDADTLARVACVDRPCRALVAARVGNARLIDNVAIPIPGGLERG